MRNFFGIPNLVQPPTQMRMRGIEPLDENPQPPEHTRLTKHQKPAIDSTIDTIVQTHPELVRLIAKWPKLPKNYREAILETIHVQTGCEVERT